MSFRPGDIVRVLPEVIEGLDDEREYTYYRHHRFMVVGFNPFWGAYYISDSYTEDGAITLVTWDEIELAAIFESELYQLLK